MIDIKINRDIEYSFIDAYSKIFEPGTIITSKNSNYSYIINKTKNAIKLKFYNPITSIWQICNFISSEEILDKWYITVK